MANARRGLHGRVVDDLGGRIVRGDVAPGDTIDLDALGHENGISRTVVREAVKVLEAKGMLEARPKRGTVVRPRADWNLLDPEVVAWCFEHGADARFLATVNEIRQIVEPAAARLAAERAADEDLATMRSALAALRAARGDIEASTEDDVALHRAILAATRNELLVRLGSLIEAGLRGHDRIAFSHGRDSDYLDRHGDVVEAIADGDGARAEAAMHRLVEIAADDTWRALTADPRS